MKNILKKLATITLSALVTITMFNFVPVSAEESTQSSENIVKKDGIVTNKSAIDNGDGTYKINLNAYSTGSIKIEESTKPLDIVLLMDQSGSMNGVYKWNSLFDTTSIHEALQGAALKFVDSVYKNATESKVSHNISLVEFASYGQIVQQLSDISKNEAYTKTKELIKAMVPEAWNSGEGSTYPGIGFTEVQKALKNSNDSGRQKVVLFFTDGEPQSPDDARNALNISKTLKSQGALVYSIAAIGGDLGGIFDKTKNVRFLTFMSSNYNESDGSWFENMSIPNDELIKDGYYLSANNPEELENVFQKVFDSIITPSIKLDKQTVLMDQMSDSFVTPSADNIKVYYQDYLGKNNGLDVFSENKEFPIDEKINVEVKNGKINVSGFDYNKYTVASTEDGTAISGKRIVVEFNTKTIDGFIGGNNVSTNTNTAGIYSKGELVETFDVPKVNVPVKFGLSKNDQSLYIGGTPTNFENMFDADPNLAGIQFVNEGNYTATIDGLVNQYVDLKYEVKDETGNLLTTFIVPAGLTSGTFDKFDELKNLVANTKVNVSATVLDKDTKAIMNKYYDKKEAIYEGTANINVFTPEVNVNDQVIFLGESVNLGSAVNPSIVWKCTNKSAKKPMGEAPILNYTYVINSQNIVQSDVVNYMPKENQNVKVNIFNKEIDITKYSEISNPEKYSDKDFMVQVVKGQLNLEAVIDQQYTVNESLKSAQSFKFKIDVRDTIGGEIKNTYYTTIEFSANEKLPTLTKTLKGLSKGYYSVSVVEDWSWKYDEDKTLRYDNYKKNGVNAGESENTNLYVGEKDGNTYYGAEDGTVINKMNVAAPASAKVTNRRVIENVLGDVATAINKFIYVD